MIEIINFTLKKRADKESHAHGFIISYTQLKIDDNPQ